MVRIAQGVMALGLCCVLRLTFGQNYVNVALGKTYNHSSAYLPNEPNLNNTTNPASYAANGNTDGTYDTTNCILTVNSDDNDWWQVDLGAEYSLYNFKVWGWDNSLYRLHPFTITVDGQTCASVTTGTFHSVDVTCSSIMDGQVVRVTRTSDTDTLNLCELQVFVCQDGWWGQQCDFHCHCLTCHRANGSCADCVAGYYGPFCDKACEVNHSKCRDNQCDRTTGLCAACPDSYEGYSCAGCRAGHYGLNCSTACRSPNCLNNRCDKDTGWCIACHGDHHGDTCSELRAASDDKDFDEEKPNVPVIGAIIGAAAIISVTIVAAVCWCRRSQQQSQRKESAETSTAGPALAMTEASSSPPPAAAPQGVRVDVRGNADNYKSFRTTSTIM